MKPARSARWAPGSLASLFVLSAFCACTPAGSQTPAAALAKIGCDFNSKKVCEQAMAHPVSFSSGITTGNQSYFQQNDPATAWEQVPIKAPGGSEIDVQCQIDTLDKTIIYAYAAPSGSVSESDRGWLMKSGFCHAGSATAPALGVRAED